MVVVVENSRLFAQRKVRPLLRTPPPTHTHSQCVFVKSDLVSSLKRPQWPQEGVIFLRVTICMLLQTSSSHHGSEQGTHGTDVHHSQPPLVHPTPPPPS